MATLDEIADGIFRINVAPSDRPVTYSLFLLRAEEPTLVETSFGAFFGEVYDALRRVIDPTTLRHVLVPHFEADECGAMNQVLSVALGASVLGGPVSARGSLADFAIRPPRVLGDQEVVDIGGKRLRILLTPQVHQWDSLMAFEETTGTLFSSDLFIRPGNGPAVSEADETEAMIAGYRQTGVMPSMAHLHAALDTIEPLPVQRIACHHGSTIAGSVVSNYYRAIREHDITSFGGRQE